MKYKAIIVIEGQNNKKINALLPETRRLKKYTISLYKNNKIIIIGKKFSHFKASLINTLKLLKTMKNLDEVLKNEQ